MVAALTLALPRMRITREDLGDAERTVLRRIERVLEAHPYLRVDLGGHGDTVPALEHVLSTRLALLHLEGPPDPDSPEAALRDALRAREAELARAVASDPTAPGAWLRYETVRLLHPDPASHEGSAPALDSATLRWERRRTDRPARTIVLEKLAQNRAFFRHGAMLPLYWLRRRRIRRCLPHAVLRERSLAETFFAVEQIGPLVDNFAFGGKAGVPWSPRVGIADIVFLYMQLADELLDELAAASGGHHAVGAFVQGLYDRDLTARPLAGLEVDQLRALGVDPAAHATKFGISLERLFAALDDTARVIDRLLDEQERDIRDAAHLFLHHCFQTYLDEALLAANARDGRPDRVPLAQAAWHFYRKNNLVMMLWLDLRARLLGLDPRAHAGAIRRWGYLLASFQIFDDLKDLALDLGKQPSYPAQIAAAEFPHELALLEARFENARRPLTRDDVAWVTRSASNTVRRCMQWSRLIALAHFDNALLYAWDQRWKKSWTRRRGSFNPAGNGRRSGTARLPERLAELIATLRRADRHRSKPEDDARLAYALDACAYDGAWPIYRALFPNVRAMYRYATLRMYMSATEKARIARRLLHRQGAAALIRLADADVDHEVGGDLFEALPEHVEVEGLRHAELRHRLEQGAA